jgi:Fic family protein
MNTPHIIVTSTTAATSSLLPSVTMSVSTLIQPHEPLPLPLPLPFSYKVDKVQEARSRINLLPDKKLALFVAERSRVDFVYNTAALEGNPFTFPEVKTLLDGITVGGHKLSDAEQVLRLNQALSHVIGLVKDSKFELSAVTAQTIQGIVAKDEAPKWGVFRDRPVFIQGTEYQVPAAQELPRIFEDGRKILMGIEDPIHRAFLVFLWGSLTQFFYDGNKRTSRFLCNGILLSAGYPPMMITAKEQLIYNQVMSQFYDSQEATEALVWFYGIYGERIKQFGFTPSPQE